MRYTDKLANMLRLGLDTNARERFGMRAPIEDRGEVTWEVEAPDNFDASPF